MGEVSATALFQEFFNGVAGDLGEVLNPAHVLQEEGKEKINVAGIRCDGVFSKPFLSNEIVKKEFFCLKKCGGEALANDGPVAPVSKENAHCRSDAAGVTILPESCWGVSAASNTIELAKFAAGFSLLATFFYTWLFITLATFQLALDTINLQFLFQLPDGILKVSSNFNFNHLGLR